MATTFTFTESARSIYRSLANFGIACTPSPYDTLPPDPGPPTKVTLIGKLPPFTENMIRQRVSVRGNIRQMEAAKEMPALNIPPERICVPQSESTKRWLSQHQ